MALTIPRDCGKGGLVMNPRASTATLLFLAVSVFALPSRAEDCRTANSGGKCECTLGGLRPLQGAVGLDEVKKKAEKLIEAVKKHPKDEIQDTDDWIKIVRGPHEQLYVTDHHHEARALIEAGRSVAVCQLQCDLSSLQSEQFWSTLKDDSLIHLEDETGRDIDVKDLPDTLLKLKNDPYRSLAYYARKEKWICRSLMKQTEFAEFLWADWFRKQPELFGAKTDSPEKFVDKAYEITKNASDKPPGFLLRGTPCPKDEERLPKCAARN
jgi:hypothetical protein